MLQSVSFIHCLACTRVCSLLSRTLCSAGCVPAEMSPLCMHHALLHISRKLLTYKLSPQRPLLSSRPWAQTEQLAPDVQLVQLEGHPTHAPLTPTVRAGHDAPEWIATYKFCRTRMHPYHMPCLSHTG